MTYRSNTEEYSTILTELQERRAKMAERRACVNKATKEAMSAVKSLRNTVDMFYAELPNPYQKGSQKIEGYCLIYQICTAKLIEDTMSDYNLLDYPDGIETPDKTDPLNGKNKSSVSASQSTSVGDSDTTLCEAAGNCLILICCCICRIFAA